MVDCFKARLRLGGFFVHWVEFVCRFYWAFLAITVSLGIGLSVGVFGASSSNEYEKLISPVDGAALRARNKLYSEFDNLFAWEAVYITSKDGGSVINYKAYDAINDWNTKYKEFSSHGKNYTDLCWKATWDTPCIDALPTHPLSFWQVGFATYLLTGVDSDEKLLAQINTGRNQFLGRPVNIKMMFGGVEPEDFMNPDGSNNITSALAITYSFPMKGNASLSDDLEDWESDFEDFCEDFSQSNEHIEVKVITNSGPRRNASKNVKENLFAIALWPGLAIYLPIFFVLFIRFDPHSSKISIGLICLISAALSVGEGIGLAVYADHNDTLTALAISVAVMLFLIIHQGYFLARYFEYSEQKDPIDHVKATFRMAGPPLLAVSMSYILCFASLSLVNVYRITYASQYLAVVCTFSLINNFTFIPAMMFLQAKAYSKGRGDLFGLFCCSPAGILCCFGKLDKGASGQPRHIGTNLFRFITKNVLRPACSYTLFFMFLGYLGVCTYFASQLDISTSILWGFETDSMVYKTLKLQDELFKQYGTGVIIASRDAILPEEQSQISMVNLIKSMKFCTGCEQQWFVNDGFMFWYPQLQAFVAAGSCKVDNSTVTLTNDGVIKQSNFMPCLDQFLNVPIFVATNFFFKSCMKYSSDGSQLMGTFGFAKLKFLESDNQIRTGINDVRSLVRNNGPGDSFIYSPYLILYDNYIGLTTEATVSLVMTSVFMFIACASVLLSLSTAFVLCLFPLFISLSQLASLEYIPDLLFNSSTCFMVTISIAGSLDYYIYFFYHLINEPGSVRQRILAASSKIAWPAASKTICILTVSLIIGITPRFYRFWFLAFLLGLQNLLQLILVVPFPTYWVANDFLTKTQEKLLKKKKRTKPNATELEVYY
mmetsp:Transcript_19606/g.36038  ORF Transcript_19606/g.36038 Transcript_19606/m.36038 type:complete len:885 (-) Transcript_19606:2477-5131(-)